MKQSDYCVKIHYPDGTVHRKYYSKHKPIVGFVYKKTKLGKVKVIEAVENNDGFITEVWIELLK